MATVLEFRSQTAKVIKDQEKVLDLVEGMEKGYKETAKEARNLQKVADQLNKATEGPQERHNRKLKELAALLHSGRIGVDQVRFAVDKYNQELHEAERGGEQAFGPMALSKVTALAGGFVSVGGAVAAAVTQLRDFSRARDEAADRTLVSRRGVAQLSQLFAEDPGGFSAAIEESRQFFAAGATQDLGEAAGLVFNLMSAGADSDTRKLFRDLASRGTLTDAASAAEATRTFQTAIGEDLAGSFRRVLNQGLAAAGPGQGTLEELLRGAAKAAPGARELGVRPESLLAAVGVLSEPLGGSTIAGDRLAALFKSLERGGFKGDLTSMLDAVQGRLNRGEGFDDVFGGTQDFEAIQGFRLAQINRAKLERLIPSVGTADSRDLISGAMGLPDTDPILRSARIRQAVEQTGQINMERHFAEAGNLLQAAMADAITSSRRDQPGFMTEMGILAGRTSVGVRRLFDDDIEALRSFSSEIRIENPELRAAIDQFLARVDEQTETLKRIEQNQSGRPPVARVEGRQE